MVDLQELVIKTGSYCSTFNNVKAWEIFGGTSKTSTLSIQKGYLKTAENTTEQSLNIRLIGSQGRTASVTIAKMYLPFIETSIDNTVSLMKGSLPNPDFKALANPPDKYPDIRTPYDPTIRDLSIENTSDIVDLFMNIKTQDDRIISVSGDFTFSDLHYSLLNSNGVELHNRGSAVSITAEITMEEMIQGKKENSNGFEGQVYTHYSYVQPEEIFKNALTRAKMGLRKSKLSTGTYPVILSPQAVVLLFNRTIASAINGLAIYEKRSFLQNYLNKRIASDQLQMQDNPWLTSGISTSAWDMEGTPTKPIEIIKDGVLLSYLHNVYTANLFKTVSTGHASRDLHSTTVGIQTSNLEIKPGNESLDSMVSGIPKGVLLDASYDHPNLVTGEFSGLIASGFLIEDGEIQHALRESMIGLNFFDFYNNIASIGKQVHRRGSNYVPHIKVNGVKISAKE